MLNWRAFLLTFVLILFTELYLEGTSRFAFGEEVWFRVSTLLCMVLAGSLWQFFSVRRGNFLRAAAQTSVLCLPVVIVIVVNAFTVHRGLAKDEPSTVAGWIGTFLVWFAILAVPIGLLSALGATILRLAMRQGGGRHLV